MSSTYAALVEAHGLSASHRLVLDAVADSSRVLDVGAATGYLARELRRRGCAVTCVEVDPGAAAVAEADGLETIRGDITDPATRSVLPRGVDAVLFADVLEHLYDPLATLRFAHELLAPGGRVVASIPNVAVWHARRELLAGRFPYSDHGIFDRTHLRFFTRATARELAERAGFAVASERFAPASLPFEARAGGLARLRERAARARPELFALQFVLVLEPR